MSSNTSDLFLSLSTALADILDMNWLLSSAYFAGVLLTFVLCVMTLSWVLTHINSKPSTSPENTPRSFISTLYLASLLSFVLLSLPWAVWLTQGVYLLFQVEWLIISSQWLFTLTACYLIIQLLSFERHPINRLFFPSIMLALTVLVQPISLPSSTLLRTISAWDVSWSFMCFSGMTSIALLCFYAATYQGTPRKRSIISVGFSLLFCMALVMHQYMQFHPLRLSFSTYSFVSVASGFWIGAFLAGTFIIAVICRIRFQLFQLNKRRYRLQKANVEQESLFNALPFSVICLDQDDKIRVINPAAETLFSCSRDMALNASIYSLFDNERHYAVFSRIKGALAQLNTHSSISPFVLDYTPSQGEQKTLHVAITAYEVVDNNVNTPCVVLTFNDMSEQAHLHYSLRENAKQYRGLIANLPCITFREHVNPVRHLVFVSDSVKLITGYSSSTLTSEKGMHQLMDRIHPDDVEQYSTRKKQAANQLSNYECRYRFLTRDDEEKWLWEMGHCYQTEEGRKCVDGIIADVTDEQASHQTAETKIKIIQKTASNQMALLSNLGVEFRSSMNAILGLTQLLLDDEKKTERRQHLEVIRQSSENLLDRMIHILDASSLDTLRLPLMVNRFSLPQLCRQIEFTTNSTRAGAQLVLNLHHEMGSYYQGDAKRIKQLLQHAIQFRFQSTHNACHLHVMPWKEKTVRFVLSHSQQKSSDSTDELHDESSVSLTLISQLIELMEGEWWLDDAKNGTSLLYIDLPLISDDEWVSTNNAVDIQLPDICLQIMDDVERQQKEFTELALRKGIDVLTYTNRDRTKDAICNGNIHVIFLDPFAPPTHFPSLAEMKSWAEITDAGCPYFVALTVSSDTPSADIWQAQGYDYVLSKPFDSHSLMQVLTHLFPENSHVSSVDFHSFAHREMFDSVFVLRTWRDMSLYVHVLAAFYRRYEALLDLIVFSVKDERELLSTTFENFVEQAQLLGLHQLSHRAKQVLPLLFFEEQAFTEAPFDDLREVMNETYEAAFSFLGIREKQLQRKEYSLSAAEFVGQMEILSDQLANEQLVFTEFERFHGEFAEYVPPDVLLELFNAVESFEFSDANQLLQSTIMDMQVDVIAGMKGYGI